MHIAGKLLAFLLGTVLLMSAGAAVADDWVAVKLRGSVFMYVGDEWVKLARGDVVSDQQVIRTQPTGRVTFQRDAETVEVGPNSQIQIIDRAGRRFTTVKQWYGSVEVEAEVQNVQHFAVQTPYLAAIVKGTRFTVSSGDGTSTVTVKRGRVEVDGLVSGERVVITAGQSARSAPGSGELSLGGRGVGQLTLPGGTPGSAALFGPRSGTGAAVQGSSEAINEDSIFGLDAEVGGVNLGVAIGRDGDIVDLGAGIGALGGTVSAGGSLSSGFNAGVSIGGGGSGAGLLGLGLETGGLTNGDTAPATIDLQAPLGGVHLSLPGL